MSNFDILFSASEYSELAGKIMMFSSGFILCLQPIIHLAIPNSIIDSDILFNTCRLSLFWCLLGAFYFAIKYRNILHPSTKSCLKCGSKMEYTAVKCLDEKKKGCKYSIKLSVGNSVKQKENDQ